MKEFWKKIIRLMVIGILLTGPAVVLPGCDNDSAIEDAAEDTGEAVEDTGEEIGEAAEDAVD